MAEKLEFKSSHSFKGIIWNTLADEPGKRLFLELRDMEEKKVSFSAWNLQNNEWLWKDISLEEPWWVSLGAIAGDLLLLTMYTDTSNPDQKSLIAYHVLEKRIIWWRNGFSLSEANTRHVMGVDTKFSSKEIILDLFTGQPVSQVDSDLVVLQNFPVIRPFQYKEGAVHFDTVRSFMQADSGINPVTLIEYLEFEMLIFVSVFVKERDLANYLYVFSPNGDELLKEKLGEGLQGVGLDTFFIFSGNLIFVKNKRELISYKIV